MASFIDFNTLKVFKVAAFFLKTTENGTKRDSLINIYPPNLETLHLIRFQACFESLLEALEQLLAQNSPQQIPSLRKLILEENESVNAGPDRLMDVLWNGTQETVIEKLRSVAAAHGASVDVIETVDEEIVTDDEETATDDEVTATDDEE